MLGESTEVNAAQDRLMLFGIAAAIAILLLLPQPSAAYAWRS